MARKRKSISTRLRFEIFKRDGFRCVYCGSDPNQGPLHVDHVVAVANGGSFEPENLVTACQRCNGGKAAVPLEYKAHAPVTTKADLDEHLSQIRAYLETQRELSAARKAVADDLASHWEAAIGPMTQQAYDRIPGLLETTPHADILDAIAITGRKLGTVGYRFDAHTANSQTKYFYGILRRKRTERGE